MTLDEQTSSDLGQTTEHEAALARFRNSVAFQFNFVFYSGMEVEKAIDHICSAALRLIAEVDASEVSP